MRERRRNASWLWPAGVLAAALLASPAPAIDGLTAPAWSPSRDAAAVSDGPLASSVVVPADASSEMPAEPTSLSRSLLMKRPAGLSRPAPGRPRGYLAQTPHAVETLPSVVGSPLIVGGEVVGDAATYSGMPLPGITFYDEGPLGQPRCGLCCDAGCESCCGNWNSCGPVPPRCLLPRPSFDGLEFFGGVQGFTSPLNRGASGSFGFHEGFNWGLPFCGCMAFQWGAMATHSNFDGNVITTDDRNQFFHTLGLFRRVDWGLQGGLVIDYFHDEWDYTSDAVQLRGELSWLFECRDEIGFWFTAGTNDANNIPLTQPVADEAVIVFDTRTTAVEVNDLFAIFYRRQFARGGEGRLFGGWTSNQQGLVGGDIEVPINPCWGLRAGFLYVVPDDEDQPPVPGFVEESWNVGISLVWTPCRRSACGPNYVRPLFHVADNGSFLTRVARP